MRRRVVITGLGPVSGFGVGVEALWSGMTEARSAVGRISSFDPEGFDCTAGAEVELSIADVRRIVPKSHRKATKVMCRDIELAVAGAAAAVEDAALVTRATDPDAEPTLPPSRVGCHIGAGLIAADQDELAAALWTSRNEEGAFDLGRWGSSGMENLTPLWLLKYLPNMLACHVTIIHDCQGPSNTITCCEASSGLSIGESMRVIQRDAADACLSGGAESKANLMAHLRQEFAGRLASCNGSTDPGAVLRPFDPEATGTVLGEGGGIIIVEALDSATARGVTPYAELIGFASTQSLNPDTVGLEIDPDGVGVMDAIEAALDRAGRPTIDAIVPFASSIPRIDSAEAAAIEQVFGPETSSIPIITVMPNVGNCQAGSGTVSVAVAAKALREQRLPARLHSRTTGNLDAVACASRPAPLSHVLVISTSQGGQNVALVLRKM